MNRKHRCSQRRGLVGQNLLTVVRHNPDKGADESSRLAGHIARGWSNASETSQRAIENVEQVELVVTEIRERHPNKATHAGGKVGVEKSVGGLKVGSKGGSAVEEVPATPNEDSTNNSDGQVVIRV